MRLILQLFFVLVAMLVAATGVADDENGQDAWQETRNEGVALFDKGKYPEALAAFRLAYLGNSDWHILYNIGQCEAEIHQFDAAINAFEKYLAKGGAEIEPQRKKEVESLLVQLRGRQAFWEGTALFESEKYDAAALMFRRANQINPNWKVFYNIAQSEAAAGHYGRAVEDFEKYLALGADDIYEARQKEVENELERLRSRVGFAEVTAPSGAQIFVDEQMRGTAPLAGRLIIVAGMDHELKVVLNDKILESRKIKVSGQKSISVAVKGETGGLNDGNLAKKAGKSGSPRQPEHSSPEKRKNIMTKMGVGLMATGGASVTASLITGLVITKRRSDLNCPDGKCPSDYHEDNERVNDLIKVGNVLLGVGAGVAAIGAVLFFVGKKRYGREQTVVAMPAVGPHSTGVVLTGRF